MVVASVNFLFIAMMVKLLESFKDRVPVGYEDESGFHFGIGKH